MGEEWEDRSPRTWGSGPEADKFVRARRWETEFDRLRHQISKPGRARIPFVGVQLTTPLPQKWWKPNKARQPRFIKTKEGFDRRIKNYENVGENVDLQVRPKTM